MSSVRKVEVAVPPTLEDFRFGGIRCIEPSTLSLVDSPVTLQEGLKILERDDHRCSTAAGRRASFENALVMRVDFVVPRLARKEGRAIW